MLIDERVVAAGDGGARELQRLFVERAAADLDAQGAHELGLHRIREHGDASTATRAGERRREGAVARLLALVEGHLRVAVDAEEFHGPVRSVSTASTTAPGSQVTPAPRGENGMRASSGISNAADRREPASPANNGPMLSHVPQA